MTTPRLVLASTSPTRRGLLERAGFAFDAVSPGVDEVLEQQGDPVAQAKALAEAKARAVAVRFPDAIVVGADQVLAVGGEVYGKAPDAAAARAQLARLSGGTHALVTGLCVIAPGEHVLEHEETRLTFRALTDEELDRYVATGEWEGCAGSYRVEGRGIGLCERIDGDWTNVLGLPMPRLCGHLRRLGIPLFG